MNIVTNNILQQNSVNSSDIYDLQLTNYSLCTVLDNLPKYLTSTIFFHAVKHTPRTNGY